MILVSDWMITSLVNGKNNYWNSIRLTNYKVSWEVWITYVMSDFHDHLSKL